LTSPRSPRRRHPGRRRRFQRIGLPVDAARAAPDLVAARDLGISLFAGEAEGRSPEVFADALHRPAEADLQLHNDLPGLQQQVTPFLPIEIVRR